MVDSLAMFFGAKKRRKSPKRRASPKRSTTSRTVVVRGRERKLYKGKNGGMFYKTKSGRTYVDAKFVRAHSKHSMSPKRRRRASPKRRRRSPVRRTRRTRYGYGLGQPSLIDMMGPAGLTVMPHHHVM